MFIFLLSIITVFSAFYFQKNEKTENLGKFQYSLMDFKVKADDNKKELYYQMRLFDKNVVVENTIKNCKVSAYLDKGDQFFFETERITNNSSYYYKPLDVEKVFCDNR